MEATVWYAVMAVRKNLTLDVMGLSQTLEYPHIRVFENKQDAEYYSQGKFEVLEMDTGKQINK